ncbi:YugN family protein [Virgibacillus soli]|uniref:YugN family protein n=1 Tax=Paracerasibacillus soli TaxID=480284 RepID=A0ABU5CV45_9BACI|nr:YugN family protein [Virgibacillus soli]MDY0410256.1 YugN family protein [Virgibacillus soli]
MIKLQTELEGKQAYFGHMQNLLREYGFVISGNWEYDKGKFDAVLWRDQGETIYLRLPFDVLSGALDHHDAFIQFRTPYVIKHIVHVGLDRDENSLLSATGFSQFQEPLDRDGNIIKENKWEQAGLQTIQNVIYKMEKSS